MTKLLLKTYFELKEIQNDVGSWGGEFVSSNPPRKIRLLRIESMLAALDINDINSFINFDFIETKNYDFNHLIKILNASNELITKAEIDDYLQVHLKPNPNKSIGKLNIKPSSLAQRTLYFLKKLGIEAFNLAEINHNYKNIYKGHYEVDIPTYLAISMHHEYLEKIEDKPKYMLVLDYLINPKQLNFSRTILEQKFNFPEDDLDEIDTEWF